MNSAGAWSLAIDFGTSNTAAAYYRTGDLGPRVVRLGTHTDTIPSAVIIDATAGIIVGESAVNQMGIYPGEFRAHPKLELGKEFIPVGPGQYSTTDVVAAVLSRVRDRALQYNENSPPSEVIFTHPSDWGSARKDALCEAAVKAGFLAGTLRLIEEPVAAAHYYGAIAGDPGIGERIAVFDFGGGTLDVAIIERTATGYKTIDSNGAQDLGGRNLDEILYRWVLIQLSERTGTDMAARLDAPQNLGMKLTLRDSVRKAKENLTTNETVKIPVTVPGFNDALVITGSDYREMIQPLVDRGVKLTKNLLDHHGGHVGRIYLTGGASQTPSIRTSLELALGQAPLTRDDLKLVVVEGALRAPKTALQVYLETDPPEPAPPEPEPEPEPEKKRNWITALSSAAVLLLIAFGITLAVGFTGPEDEDTRGCLPSETYDSNVQECVPDPDSEGPEDCVGDEVWDSDLESCVPSPSPNVACWDGSQAESSFDCPPFEGEAALLAGFWTETGSCVAMDPSAYEGWVGDAVEAMQCTWADLPFTKVNIARYGQDATGYWNTAGTFQGLEVSDETWVDSSGNALGTSWEAASYSANSEAQWTAQIFAYADLPLSVEVFTNLVNGGDIGANAEASSRLRSLSTTGVEKVLLGMP